MSIIKKSLLIISLITAPFIHSEIAVKAQNQTMSLSQWCEEKSLSPETEKTLNAMIKALNVKTCAEAVEIAPKVFTLTIANQNITDIRPITSLVNVSGYGKYRKWCYGEIGSQ